MPLYDYVRETMAVREFTGMAECDQPVPVKNSAHHHSHGADAEHPDYERHQSQRGRNERAQHA